MKEQSEVCDDSWSSLPLVLSSAAQSPQRADKRQWFLEVIWLQGLVI